MLGSSADWAHTNERIVAGPSCGCLVGEALVDHMSPCGGGYFFALTGVRNKDDWSGRGLMEA